MMPISFAFAVSSNPLAWRSGAEGWPLDVRRRNGLMIRTDPERFVVQADACELLAIVLST